MSRGNRDSERIGVLNDQARSLGPASTNRVRWVITSGITALGPDGVVLAIQTVRDFTAFDQDNDPYGEHDFGTLDVDGKRLFFKVDYYRRGSDYTEGAEMPEDPNTTDRILTLMLAEEY